MNKFINSVRNATVAVKGAVRERRRKYAQLRNEDIIEPLFVVYKRSFFPYFLAGLQVLLIAVYMEARSWKYGHLTLQEKYDQHAASNLHCPCTEANPDPFFQKHPTRPMMTTVETWEGFIVMFPTLALFLYVGFTYGNNETKYYLYTRKLRKRRAEGQRTSADEAEEDMRMKERSENNWILSEVLTYILSPILVAIKLSFGIGDQFNWYIALGPFILLCWYHAFNAAKEGNYWFREQAHINMEITRNNMELQVENMERDGASEEELQELRAVHDQILADVSVLDEDDQMPQSETPISDTTAAPTETDVNKSAAVLPTDDDDEKVTLSQKEIANKLPFGKK